MLQIGIPCGRNCESYINFLLYTIEKTIDINTVEIILAINDDDVQLNILQKVAKKYKNIKFLGARNKGGFSLGHSYALDRLLYTFYSRYAMFIDCDIAMLTNDWDKKLLAEMTDDTVIVGSEYDGAKYLGFPNTTFCLFDVQALKEKNISFSLPEQKHIIVDEKNSYIFGRAAGEKIMLDTGWELVYKLKSAGLKGIPMKLVSPRIPETIPYMKFMKNDMRGESYQLKNEPVCTHIGRSYTRSFEDPIVVLWRKRVKEWLNGQD